MLKKSFKSLFTEYSYASPLLIASNNLYAVNVAPFFDIVILPFIGASLEIDGVAANTGIDVVIKTKINTIIKLNFFNILFFIY